MLLEPKYLGLNYSTRLLPRWLFVAYYMGYASVAPVTCTVWLPVLPHVCSRTGIKAASRTFLFGFLSCGNNDVFVRLS